MNNCKILVVFFLALNLLSCDISSTKSPSKDIDDSEVLDGKYIDKYASGKIAKIRRYKEGKPHGIQEVYNKNGILQNTITYIDGVKEGEAIIYYENGKPYRVSQYKNKMLEGMRKKYRRNGNLWSTQSYHNSFPGPDLVEFTDSGKKKKIPKLIIRERNTLRENSKYSIHLSVEGTYKKVAYFEGKLSDGKYFDNRRVVPVVDQIGHKAELNRIIAPGHFFMRKYHFIAKVTTHANNNYFLYKTFNVAVENI